MNKTDIKSDTLLSYMFKNTADHDPHMALIKGYVTHRAPINILQYLWLVWGTGEYCILER